MSVAETTGPDVAGVVAQLETVVERARAQASPVGYFPALYRQTTLAVRQGIEAGSFDDGDRISRFVVGFASRYFDALTAWEQGQKPTRSWRGAFEAGARPDRLILHHLLLGINAHINLDLAVAAARVVVDGAIEDLRDDFLRVNDTLSRLMDPAQDVVARFSPLLGVLDRVGGRTDDHVLNFSVRRARDEAWRQAVLLSRLGPAEQDEAVSLLDRKVAFLGRIVDEPGGIVGPAVAVIRHTESDDVPAIIDSLLTIVPLTPTREVASPPVFTGSKAS